MEKWPRNIPVPGAKTVTQVRDNAAAIEFDQLPAEMMAEIETLIQRDADEEPRKR